MKTYIVKFKRETVVSIEMDAESKVRAVELATNFVQNSEPEELVEFEIKSKSTFQSVEEM